MNFGGRLAYHRPVEKSSEITHTQLMANSRLSPDE